MLKHSQKRRCRKPISPYKNKWNGLKISASGETRFLSGLRRAPFRWAAWLMNTTWLGDTRSLNETARGMTGFGHLVTIDIAFDENIQFYPIDFENLQLYIALHNCL